MYERRSSSARRPPNGRTPFGATEGPAECPDAAKIGTVEIDTPLLDHPLPRGRYLATPFENPFDSLLAIYVAVNDPISGVVVKLAGHVEIGPEGQLTTTFDGKPAAAVRRLQVRLLRRAAGGAEDPDRCAVNPRLPRA